MGTVCLRESFVCGGGGHWEGMSGRQWRRPRGFVFCGTWFSGVAGRWDKGSRERKQRS